MEEYMSESSDYALDLAAKYGDDIVLYSNEISDTTNASVPGFGVAVALTALGAATYLAFRDLYSGGDEVLEEDLKETVDRELEPEEKFEDQN